MGATLDATFNRATHQRLSLEKNRRVPLERGLREDSTVARKRRHRRAHRLVPPTNTLSKERKHGTPPFWRGRLPVFY